MIGEIKMHDVVALLQDMSTKHFESGQALLLRRGQIVTAEPVNEMRHFPIEDYCTNSSLD